MENKVVKDLVLHPTTKKNRQRISIKEVVDKSKDCSKTLRGRMAKRERSINLLRLQIQNRTELGEKLPKRLRKRGHTSLKFPPGTATLGPRKVITKRRKPVSSLLLEESMKALSLDPEGSTKTKGGPVNKPPLPPELEEEEFRLNMEFLLRRYDEFLRSKELCEETKIDRLPPPTRVVVDNNRKKFDGSGLRRLIIPRSR